MPESSRRIYATHVVRISKEVAVPIRYAYDWCTDFRTDDGKFSGSGPSFRVLRLSKDRIVRVRSSSKRSDSLKVAVELIRLHPPDAWHLDQIDEADLNTVDYKLTRVGAKKTRLTLDLVERWMIPDYPSKSEWVLGTNQYWDELLAELEARYRSGKPARG